MRKAVGLFYLVLAVIPVVIAIANQGHPFAWWGYVIALPSLFNGLYRLLTEDK